MFAYLGVIDLDNKKRIVNYFIDMCEFEADYEEKIEIIFQSTGVATCLSFVVDNFCIYDQSVIIETETGSVSISLKEYEVKLTEDEGVFTLQFKNESNEIRISI